MAKILNSNQFRTCGAYRHRKQGAGVCHVLADQLDESLCDFANQPQYDHGTLDDNTITALGFSRF